MLVRLAEWEVGSSVPKPSERSIAQAIRSAASKLPVSPTDASWTRYRNSIARDLEAAMIRSAEAAARAAGRAVGTSGKLSASTRRRISSFASKQATLITSNARRAATESARALRRAGLTARQSRQVLSAIGGLNRRQAGAVVGRMTESLRRGGMFGGALRRATSDARKYLAARARDIALVQSARAANLGAMDQLDDDAPMRWRAKTGACELCRELHGTVSTVKDGFRHPETGEKVYGGDVHMHCRCQVEYEVERARAAS